MLVPQWFLTGSPVVPHSTMLISSSVVLQWFLIGSLTCYLLPDIAVLVLVFNAAQWCPSMPALFSDHTFRHYAYLRDSLSHLVPPLRVRTLKTALLFLAEV